MAKVIFINRFFFPDHSATSQMLSDLAFHVADCGMRVVVVASRQKYDDPDAGLAKNEDTGGVIIHRIWTTNFGRRHLPGRAIDYLTFYTSAFWALLRLSDNDDVIVAKTDPPLISVVAALAARIRGAVLANWLQDLFPEVATELHVTGMKVLDPLIRPLRNYSLRTANNNIAIGECMAERVRDENVDVEKITVIHNWSDGGEIYPLSRGENPLREEWGLSDRFVVGYSGNLGRAHEFETILSAASLLQQERNIVFLFIGGGAQYERLRDRVADSGLNNIVFKPYQPRECLLYSLCVPDVHLVSLQPALEGLIVPSKFYGIAAAGRPAVYIGSYEGEVPAILRESECGITVATGDAQGLRDCIYRLSSESHTVEDMGRNARAMFEAKFDRRVALDAWQKVIHALLARSGSD